MKWAAPSFEIRHNINIHKLQIAQPEMDGPVSSSPLLIF